MSRRRAVVVLLLFGALMARAVSTADASGLAPEKKGWWSATGAPVPTLVPGAGGATSGAPDVPDGGLYIAGSATNPFAVSAVRYLLPHGTAATSFALTVAPNSVMLPGTKVRVCPLTGSRNFESTQAGALTSAPPWDCANGVDGVLDPSGVAFSFVISSLVVDDVLALAIVPAGSNDRVAFAPPDPTSLPLAELRAPGAAPVVPTTSAFVPPPAPFVPSVVPPPIGARPTVTPGATSGASPAPIGTPASSIGLPVSNGHGASSALVGALGVGILAVAVWWRGRKLLSIVELTR